MYSIPPFITLLGINIPIILVTPEEIAQIEELESDTYGAYSAKSEKIFINNSYSPQKQWETLTHEIIHALLSLSSHNTGLSDDTEERFVSFLERFYVPAIVSLVLANNTPESSGVVSIVTLPKVFV